MKRFIEWLSTRFVDGFGTPAAFAVCTAIFIVWLVPLPVEGWAKWNGGFGLLGNTTESTVELFLAVATLIVARRVDVEAKRAKTQRDEADAKRDEIVAMVERMEEEHGTMLTDLHKMTKELHKVAFTPVPVPVPKFTGRP